MRVTSFLLCAVGFVSGLHAIAATPVSFNVPQRGFSLGGAQPSSAASGDFNGDGIIDLITVAYPHNLLLSLGNGDGTFQNPLSATLVGQPDYMLWGISTMTGN